MHASKFAFIARNSAIASFPRLPASSFDSLQCAKTNCKLSKTRGGEGLGMRLKQNCAWCFEVHSSQTCHFRMSRYTGQKKCSVYMKSDVEDRDKCRMCITFGTILYRIGRENSQNVRLGGGHCIMVVVSQYQMNLSLKRGNAMDVIEKRDKDYCVSMHPHSQFSMCVYSTTNRTACSTLKWWGTVFWCAWGHLI